MRAVRASSAVGAAFCLWGLAIGLLALHDNSFLTELATGRLIVHSGIPHADPYSFTAHGHPWTLQSWLASALYGALDRLWDGHGLVAFHAVLTTALAYGVWRLTAPALSLAGRIIAAVVPLAVGTGYWASRPLLIALVAFAVVVFVVESGRAPLWVLAPVMWIWVNVHGSWPFAVAYLVLRLAGRALDRRPLDRLPRQLGAVAVGIVLGAANPFGFGLLAYPLAVVTHHQAFSHIVEWQSPSFSDLTNLVFLFEAVLALGLLVLRKGRVEDALVVLAFLVAACVASRNVPVAALVTVPVLARGLQGLGTIDGAARSPTALAGVALLVVLGALVAGKELRRPAYDLTAYPVREVSAMVHQGLAPGRVATQDFVGNYLEYRFGARASTFIDDRVDMFPASVESAYGVLLGGAPNWQAVLDRYRVDTVLWAANQPLASLVEQSPGWRVVLHDRKWVVAVRVGPLAAGTTMAGSAG
ncbi:MAG TPA: hypothetical protein VE991_10845 [Acidimicrobiales bacterium]|nr:hypothetical protein [Acidimicrobiales bacterium]